MMEQDASVVKTIQHMTRGFTSVSQAAKMLGIERSQLERWTLREVNACPSFKIGKINMRFVHPDAVVRWMERYSIQIAMRRPLK